MGSRAATSTRTCSLSSERWRTLMPQDLEVHLSMDGRNLMPRYTSLHVYID
jgi:hypothetical protein